jgi:hypothetical protein
MVTFCNLPNTSSCSASFDSCRREIFQLTDSEGKHLDYRAHKTVIFNSNAIIKPRNSLQNKFNVIVHNKISVKHFESQDGLLFCLIVKNYWSFLDVIACIVYFHIEYVTLNSGCDVEVNI